MACIAGVDIPRDKRVVVSFTCVYGTGNTAVKEVSANVGVSENARIRNSTNEQADAIHVEIDKLKAEGDPRREVNLSIKYSMEIDSYRGICHRHGLPTRGQNTKNNTRTCKDPTKTAVDKER